MAKTIAICNQKGGVGKTSTSSAIMSALTLEGFKVLGVDLDSQSNLTLSAGADNTRPTTLGVLTNEVKAVDAVQNTTLGDLIPASPQLANADQILTATGKEYRLKKALEPIGSKYDYCIIDTPPALGVLTVNALTACDYVVIPAKADLFSLQGIDQLTQTIEAVKEYCNPRLKVAGIVITMFNARATVHREALEVIDQLAQRLDTAAFTTKIRYSVKLSEAPFKQTGLFQYAPKEKVTQDYKGFIDELLERVGRP